MTAAQKPSNLHKILFYLGERQILPWDKPEFLFYSGVVKPPGKKVWTELRLSINLTKPDKKSNFSMKKFNRCIYDIALTNTEISRLCR